MTRFATALAALFALTVTVSALAQTGDPKETEKNLLGTWKLAKTSEGELPPGLNATITFEAGGKTRMNIELKETKKEVNGSWTLDGKKLTIEYADGPAKGVKEVREITKLTATDLVTTNEKQVTEEFTKAAAEPKKEPPKEPKK